MYQVRFSFARDGGTGEFAGVEPEGTLSMPNKVRSKEQRGNGVWHLDSPYMPLASKAGMLRAITLSSSGGETELVDRRAAPSALAERMKTRIAQRSA